MPELPEVETVKNELTPHIIGREFTGVTLFWDGIVNTYMIHGLLFQNSCILI